MERTPYFAPEVQLAFLRNSITAELFMAPAIGVNATEAEANLRETYPSAVYNLMALYPAASVQRYLADLHRWPGLPSKTQPSLTDLLASLRIRSQTGGLPPLHRQPAKPAEHYPAGLNAAQVAQVQTIAKGMPPETRELAARLLGVTPAAAAVIPDNANPFAPAASAQPAAKLHPFAPRPATPRANPVPQGSLKDALAALRSINGGTQGISATVQHSATPATNSLAPISRSPQATAQPAATYTPALSAAALPPSARGTMQEDTAPAPSAFAVGKVSAISVLKAMRQQR
jgi:hypothetical protein